MNAPQRSDEWFQARRQLSVTGSMAGSVLGHNPHCSPEQALRNKVRECLGLPPDKPMNQAMQKGVDMEQAAREAYEAHTGRLVAETGLRQCATIQWMGSSPDGEMPDRCLEIKVRDTPKPIAERPWELDQCQMHIACTGKIRCDYWQWNESGGVLETVEFDPEWWGRHGETLFAFHERLQEILADEELQKPFAEPLIDRRTDAAFLQAEHTYYELKQALEAAQEAEKRARDELLKITGDKRCEGDLVKITTFERQGTINWKAKDIQNALAVAGVNPEKYRGKPSVQTRITVK